MNEENKEIRNLGNMKKQQRKGELGVKVIMIKDKKVKRNEGNDTERGGEKARK